MPRSYLHPELGDELCPWENGPHLQPLSASLTTSCPMTHFMPSQQRGSGCPQQHYETRTQGSSLLHPGHMLPPSLVFSSSIFFSIFFSLHLLFCIASRGAKLWEEQGSYQPGDTSSVIQQAGWVPSLPLQQGASRRDGCKSAVPCSCPVPAPGISQQHGGGSRAMRPTAGISIAGVQRGPSSQGCNGSRALWGAVLRAPSILLTHTGAEPWTGGRAFSTVSNPLLFTIRK